MAQHAGSELFQPDTCVCVKASIQRSINGHLHNEPALKKSAQPEDAR